MKKILPIWTLTLLLFTACATFPPPKIQDGRYINPKYGFSIKVPNGWKQTKKAPDWMNLLPESKGSPRLVMLSNQGRDGIIFIASDKLIPSVPFSEFNEIPSFDNVIPGSFGDYTYQPMKQGFEKRKQQLSKNRHIKNYSYKLRDIKSFTEEYSYKTKFYEIEMRAEYVMYECQGDETCIVGISLYSNIKMFDENYKAFNKVVDSFCKIKYIPENKTKDVSENLIKNLLPTDWIGAAMGWWAAGGIW